MHEGVERICTKENALVCRDIVALDPKMSLWGSEEFVRQIQAHRHQSLWMCNSHTKLYITYIFKCFWVTYLV